MSEEEVAANVRRLLLDDGFAAVLGLVARTRDGFAGAGSSQALADSHGKQSHCLGSYYGLDVLLGLLREIAEPADGGGEQPPEEEGTA